MNAAVEHVRDLAAFVAASPSSFHAAAEGAGRLAAAGFRRVDERSPYTGDPGAYAVVRDGALLAWRIPAGAAPGTPYRIVGAHTDSPGFVLKPHPDIGAAGWQQLGMEIYGGPLLNSWLDRELGLAGRVILRGGESRLVRTGAIMRIPQLAVHLDRSVNDEGLKLDRQQHTAPVWSVGRPDLTIMDQVALLAGCPGGDIDGSDLVAYTTTPPEVFGPTEEFLASGRLDNLSSVHAALTALIGTDDSEVITMLAAFDHEEVGSGSLS
ncbi:MAG: M18 family aminopeptidase, partial [Microlunatus sp.]|nr:M18 family aminopeptidase [Microlunatus sp.]